ncbi:MAG: hypothetical protein ACLPZM_05400 [Thermoplasmata archaeon]
MAAVATLLGLLLVVSFIANYLSTQVPNQMAVNDLNHDLAVENQLARLDALLETASANYATGAQLTQPVSLGSGGVPPFAPSDTAYTGTTVNGSLAQVNYSTTTFASHTPVPLVGGMLVHMQNSYSPIADIAYTYGGVVFAQIGGTPIFTDSPDVTATASGGAVTALHIWLPEFINRIPSVQGGYTANVVARLISVNIVVVSSATQLSFAPGSNVVLTLTSQFAPAWMSYYAGLNLPGVTYSCAPAASVACTGPYNGNGALATVVLSVPTTSLVSLSVTVALFALSIQ